MNIPFLPGYFDKGLVDARFNSKGEYVKHFRFDAVAVMGTEGTSIVSTAGCYVGEDRQRVETLRDYSDMELHVLQAFVERIAAEAQLLLVDIGGEAIARRLAERVVVVDPTVRGEG